VEPLEPALGLQALEFDLTKFTAEKVAPFDLHVNTEAIQREMGQ